MFEEYVITASLNHNLHFISFRNKTCNKFMFNYQQYPVINRDIRIFLNKLHYKQI